MLRCFGAMRTDRRFLVNWSSPSGHYPYRLIFADPCFHAGTRKFHCCAFANVRNVPAMKIERSEDHREATKALVLAMAGLMAIILLWHLVMMLLYGVQHRNRDNHPTTAVGIGAAGRQIAQGEKASRVSRLSATQLRLRQTLRR